MTEGYESQPGAIAPEVKRTRNNGYPLVMARAALGRGKVHTFVTPEHQPPKPDTVDTRLPYDQLSFVD